MLVTADVKCYYCGHVSGQVIGPKEGPIRASSFVPRPGYTKPAPRPGEKLRCERCQGPVYLEDVTPSIPEAEIARALSGSRHPEAA